MIFNSFFFFFLISINNFKINIYWVKYFEIKININEKYVFLCTYIYMMCEVDYIEINMYLVNLFSFYFYFLALNRLMDYY